MLWVLGFHSVVWFWVSMMPTGLGDGVPMTWCAFRKLWPLFSGNSGRFLLSVLLGPELFGGQVFGPHGGPVEA